MSAELINDQQIVAEIVGAKDDNALCSYIYEFVELKTYEFSKIRKKCNQLLKIIHPDMRHGDRASANQASGKANPIIQGIRSLCQKEDSQGIKDLLDRAAACSSPPYNGSHADGITEFLIKKASENRRQDIIIFLDSTRGSVFPILVDACEQVNGKDIIEWILKGCNLNQDQVHELFSQRTPIGESSVAEMLNFCCLKNTPGAQYLLENYAIELKIGTNRPKQKTSSFPPPGSSSHFHPHAFFKKNASSSNHKKCRDMRNESSVQQDEVSIVLRLTAVFFILLLLLATLEEVYIKVPSENLFLPKGPRR